jgi:beta-galactosidase/beta-glucuronidase
MMTGTTAAHPRPDQRRDTVWWSLDGPWDFFPDRGYSVDTLPARPARTITVPFAWETPASGIEEHWLSRAWYRREIEAPDLPDGLRLVLHFGAVHHAAQVWIDGGLVATHVGGQAPFEVDITSAVGAQRSSLVICVDAPLDKGEIPHGKQRSIPPDPYDVCSFNPCSGIWQSVWLEQRPPTYLRTVEMEALPDLDGFRIQAAADGPDRSEVVVHARIVATGDHANWDDSGAVGVLPVAAPRLWSPIDPHLYVIEVELRRADVVLDRLLCTTGLRTVTVRGAHLLLNGERCYLRGVLDQGYWPESGWTAPNEQALVADLVAAADAGFTLVRKHLKLEDPRWLHHADQLGMLVWEEPASTSRFTERSVNAFESQIPAMVARDRNHPSIVIWGLYNEEWGLDWDVANDPAKRLSLEGAYAMITELDDSRPVIDNSGWSHVRTDLTDWHIYSLDHAAWTTELADLRAGAERGFVVNLGPGGPVRKYVNADGSSIKGTASLNSEYGSGTTSVERAWTMRWQTQELRRMDDLNGYVYTELYDIEHETVGILTDRRRSKDTLGLVPDDCHTDTVIVVDVVPLAPGCDLMSAPNGKFSVELRVSHHGPEQLLAHIQGGWGPPLSSVGHTPTESCVELKADPFVLSESAMWHDQLPDRLDQARLHLWIWGSDGEHLAHSVLDVRRAPPAVRVNRN